MIFIVRRRQTVDFVGLAYEGKRSRLFMTVIGLERGNHSNERTIESGDGPAVCVGTETTDLHSGGVIKQEDNMGRKCSCEKWWC